MPSTVSTIQTEADALRDIVAWSSDRPVWQRDALRRLVTNAELTEADIDELAALCKKPTLPFDPVQISHISASKTGAPTVSLKAIRNAENINALAEGQSLGFIPKGVTIVYGDNGAGKSGYVRILKRACRARAVRGKEDPILHNIYDASARGTQRAEIEYNAGAQTQKGEWKNGEKSDDLLSEVSVFDSRTANVHVDETNDLAYTPFPMKLLEQLVVACQSVKGRLDGEVSSLRNLTPQSISNPKCSADTRVGAFIKALSASSKPETLETLASLSTEEATSLAELTADLAQDPKVAAQRLRAQKSRLQSIANAIEALDGAVSDEVAVELAGLTKEVRVKVQAAKLAAESFSKDEPLSSVGSDVWKSLWESARAYSIQAAYPEQSFPVTDEDARCVLCHQELDEDTRLRFQRFEDFVQDQTQTQATAAQRTLQTRLQELEHARVPASSICEYRRFLRDELSNSELANAVRGYALLAGLRLRALLAGQTNLPNVPGSISQQLATTISELETRASALLSDHDSDERTAMRKAHAELKDREWISGLKDDVLAEIERKKKISALEKALKDTRANAITTKNTALSQALITDRLRATFAEEVDHLNLAGLAIELMQASSQQGVSRFRIALMKSKDRNAGEILSEGEYRCVALAGFLAELATNASDSGIIFDDPVSSLDHLHREAIAKRLAAEGRKRQIIVFTHDLPFLFMLRNACIQVEEPSMKTEVALRHIQKKQDKPGHCRNEAPDKAKDAASRLKSMRAHLSKTKVLYDNDPDGVDWLITARGLIDSLRQAWESAVEDAISPVLRTFASKVDTKGFAKLSAITEADASTMRQHYGQCSVMLHKASDAINPAAPKPETIEEELDALEVWLSSVADRQSKIKVK